MRLKFLTTIIFLLTFIPFAQSQTEHLSFKGVPIDGTLEQYVMKMKENGFKHLETENGTAVLNGDFAGYKDCVIGVSILKDKNLVYKIAVVFSEQEKWTTLSGNYFDLKQMLSEKYGKPSTEEEKFDGYKVEDDQSKMLKVQTDKCKYYTTYETERGTIQLSIDHKGFNNCFVKLIYSDKVNSSIIKAKAKDDL